MEGLIASFWSEESTPFVRRMILDEASGKDEGATRWEFNMFALTLDFDGGQALVEDLLDTDETESQDLTSFLDLCATFGDNPTEGDGLTEAERHPPTYEADADGHVQRLV